MRIKPPNKLSGFHNEKTTKVNNRAVLYGTELLCDAVVHVNRAQTTLDQYFSVRNTILN